jgi:hypothetical protein
MCEITLRNGTVAIPGVAIISSGINVPLPFANDRPDRVNWRQERATLKFPGSTVSVDIERPRALSAARRHVLRLDVVARPNRSSGEGAGSPPPGDTGPLYDLTVEVLETDNVICLRTLPISL